MKKKDKKVISIDMEMGISLNNLIYMYEDTKDLNMKNKEVRNKALESKKEI